MVNSGVKVFPKTRRVFTPYLLTPSERNVLKAMAESEPTNPYRLATKVLHPTRQPNAVRRNMKKLLSKGLISKRGDFWWTEVKGLTSALDAGADPERVWAAAQTCTTGALRDLVGILCHSAPGQEALAHMTDGITTEPAIDRFLWNQNDREIDELLTKGRQKYNQEAKDQTPIWLEDGPLLWEELKTHWTRLPGPGQPGSEQERQIQRIRELYRE